MICYVNRLLFVCLLTTASVVFASTASARGDAAADSVRRGGTAADARIASAFAAESKPRSAKGVASDSSRGGGSTMIMTIAVGILALGAIGMAGRSARVRGRSRAGGSLAVVDRVSISPKHAVFLVRAGDRTLIIGTGPQGPPALFGELESTAGDAEAEPIAASSVFASLVESTGRLLRAGGLRADETEREISRAGAVMQAACEAGDQKGSSARGIETKHADTMISAHRVGVGAAARGSAESTDSESFKRPPATTVRIGGVA